MKASELDPGQWQQYSRLLDEALALEEDARAHWLASLPIEAEPLRPLLEQTLHTDSLIRSSHLEGRPLLGAADPATEWAFTAGTVIGPMSNVPTAMA